MDNTAKEPTTWSEQLPDRPRLGRFHEPVYFYIHLTAIFLAKIVAPLLINSRQNHC